MWRGDDRGQSIQIGAVLLFGALIVALAGYQAFVVPQQNKAVEFSHSQTVQEDLQDLRNAIVSRLGDTSLTAVSIELGARYPPRLIAVNPGPPTGSLRTAATPDSTPAIEIANAQTTGETGDFWDGTTVQYTTGTYGIVYRPNYNLYGTAPTTVYGNSVQVSEFPSGTVTLAGQTLIEDDRISLVALDGSLDRTGSGAASVDVRPVSSSTTTVSVSDSGSPITIRIPTRLALSTWETLLEDQFTTNGGHVLEDQLRIETVAGTPNTDVLVVELETGVDYTLQMAEVGVGTGVTDTDEAYMTEIKGDGAEVREEGSIQLIVEVRDEYNNPVSDVEVTGSAGSGSLASTTVTTDENGQAKFRYQAPEITDGLGKTAETPDTIEFTYENNPTESQRVEITVYVQNVAGGGGNGGGNGNGQQGGGA